MSVLQAIFLGIVQGITEFIPISSDGHLVLFQELLDIDPKGTLAYDIVLHLPSLLVMVFVFRKDIAGILARERRMIPLIIAGSMPVAAVGLLFGGWIEKFIWNNLYVAAAGWMTTAAAIWWGDRKAAGRSMRDLGIKEALIVGGAQAIAPLPGFSRSGLTVAGGMGVGLGREEAVRFSFLLGMPAIAGANLLAILGAHDEIASFGWKVIVCGFASSLAASYLAVRALLALARRGRLIWFAYYCGILGILVLCWKLLNP